MDDDPRDACVLGHFQKGEEVLFMAMHAPVGKQSHQMESAVSGDGRLHCRLESFVLEEGSVPDRMVDLGITLIVDPPRADGQMAHLGIAHRAGRQSDGFTMGFQRRVGIVLEDPIEIRRFGHRDGIAVFGLAESEAVQDH
jgi:hypothetical protein